jgi:hypothetical protein
MVSVETLDYLKALLKHMLYYNNMSPFPCFDTEYVEYIQNKIMDIEKENKYNYDEDPVVACKYCNHLHIAMDEDDNNICTRCGSVNELQEFENIFEYLKFKHGPKSKHQYKI